MGRNLPKVWSVALKVKILEYLTVSREGLILTLSIIAKSRGHYGWISQYLASFLGARILISTQISETFSSSLTKPKLVAENLLTAAILSFYVLHTA